MITTGSSAEPMDTPYRKEASAAAHRIITMAAPISNLVFSRIFWGSISRPASSSSFCMASTSFSMGGQPLHLTDSIILENGGKCKQKT